MKRILGIGNALVDVLAHIDNDKILNELSLPKGSMQLIDEARFREFGLVMKDMDTERATGGSAANTVLAVARLGGKPGFIGKSVTMRPGVSLQTISGKAGWKFV